MTILMMDPSGFQVEHEINPHMEGNIGLVENTLAEEQWCNLRDLIRRYDYVCTQDAFKGCPDAVFTANAGFVLDGKVLLSRFKYPSRIVEEIDWGACFMELGHKLYVTGKYPFEGGGDAIYDKYRDAIWMGYGFRSDLAASNDLSITFDKTVWELKLVDPRFYHLDTAFCALSDGTVIYYPPAFGVESNALIQRSVGWGNLIQVFEEDAMVFACNMIELPGKVLVANDFSIYLQQKLIDRGFIVIKQPVSEFMKSGGGCRCLTLEI